MTGDLFTEFAGAAGKAAEPDTVSWLGRHGVPRDIIFRGGSSVVGVSRISISGHRYEPADDGKPAILVPVSSSYATCELDPFDIAAWLPDDPAKVYLRTGIATVINEDAADRAWICEEPLLLHANPMGWLQHELSGMAIVDWSIHLPLFLGSVRRIIVTDKSLLWRIPGEVKKQRLWQPEIRLAPEALHAA